MQEEATMLPVTPEEFDQFATDILTMSGVEDKPAHRHTLATSIMHLDPTTDRKEKSYFVKSLRKSISNQVAYYKMKQIEKEETEKATPRTETDDAGISQAQA